MLASICRHWKQRQTSPWSWFPHIHVGRACTPHGKSSMKGWLRFIIIGTNHDVCCYILWLYGSKCFISDMHHHCRMSNIVGDRVDGDYANKTFVWYYKRFNRSAISSLKQTPILFQMHIMKLLMTNVTTITHFVACIMEM
jgi:hypothetical protein